MNAPLTANRTIVQLVANPDAGRHRKHVVDALAAAFEAGGAEVVRSECGPGRDLAVESCATHLCVVGGDGTMRHAARAAFECGRTIKLSLYPAGTVNLLHRESGGALHPARFAEDVLFGRSSRVAYAASIGDHHFLACASAGPDAAAVAALSPRLKRRIGRLAYGVAFLGVLIRWPKPAILLRHEGGIVECNAFYIAKARYFAGPWSFAPAARSSDPVLHVVALSGLTRRRYARFLWALLSGRGLERLPGATCFTCTQLSAEADAHIPVQADGDIAATLPLEIRVCEQPLKFA